MRDIPVVLSGYKARVSEVPAPKTRKTKDGVVEPVTDRVSGAPVFVVTLFMKPIPRPGQDFAPKGEEIKVTLPADPGEGFEEGDRVELVDPVINAYSMETEDGRMLAGIAWKALGLKPAGRSSAPAPSKASKPAA